MVFAPFPLANSLEHGSLTTCLTTTVKIEYPGLAKFGIALGLGPRDRGFKSRNPDQGWGGARSGASPPLLSYLVAGLENGGGAAAKNSPVDCFSAREEVSINHCAAHTLTSVVWKIIEFLFKIYCVYRKVTITL